MEPTNILPIVAVLSLVTVEYGGWALLSFISGREGLEIFVPLSQPQSVALALRRCHA